MKKSILTTCPNFGGHHKKKPLESIICDVWDGKAVLIGTKTFYSNDKGGYIIDWLRKFYDKKTERVAYLRMIGTDMQNNPGVFFTNQPSENDIVKHLTANITKNNLIEMCIYLSMRHSIENTWLNDRDQFLFPNDGWQSDTDFQNDCLTFALFNRQNKISGNGSVNNFIPFTEQEVNAREKFESHFMTDYIKGKLKAQEGDKLFDNHAQRTTELEFSEDAMKVFNTGRELWKYYHAVPGCNVNASLYDIREHFQGRNDKGKMNNKSVDAHYMELIRALRDSLRVLAAKIEPKVYEYGFLKR